jgi:hypothetical protein
MKKYVVIIAALALLGTLSAFAQPVSDSITVTATNSGLFTFDIAAASYAFGTVDSNGTANVGGDDSLTGVRGATASVYTASNASAWTAASAPVRTVRIFNASTTSVGSLPANRLAMQIPAAGGGTSCLYKTFGTTGDGAACAAGVLVHTMAVGNGANDVDGQLDLALTVDDVDPTGATTWTVILTATGA